MAVGRFETFAVPCALMIRGPEPFDWKQTIWAAFCYVWDLFLVICQTSDSSPHLLEKDLTMWDSKSEQADIPPLMKPFNPGRFTAQKFGFNDSLTMVSYVRKKRKSCCAPEHDAP
ncbi:unnamed protein product [Pleuronectes platessa]|uniref:Uncharacterized protein n=1 Tax=Pleuronectes platessa TaxID=8262 RepID=A0A9N7UTW5_PLEPL|nr:unnamed protein product [Pleuronectes platessa]